MMSGTEQRRARIDAQRKRAHIMEVAEQWFSHKGLTVLLDALAKRAGVGPGALYRHLPNRGAHRRDA